MKKQIKLSCNEDDDSVFKDPFAYITATTDENLALALSRCDTFYEYLYSADGYVALKYSFTRNKNIITAKVTNAFTNTSIERYKAHDLVFAVKKLSLSGFIKRLNVADVVFVNNLQITFPEVQALLSYNEEMYLNNVEFQEFICNSTNGRYVCDKMIENSQERQEFINKTIDNYLPSKNLRFLKTRVLKIYQYNAAIIKLPKLNGLEPISERKRKIIDQRFNNSKIDLIKFFANRSYTLLIGK